MKKPRFLPALGRVQQLGHADMQRISDCWAGRSDDARTKLAVADRPIVYFSSSNRLYRIIPKLINGAVKNRWETNKLNISAYLANANGTSYAHNQYGSLLYQTAPLSDDLVW